MDLFKLEPDDLRLVQRGLRELELYKGKIDGKYGPLTRDAYKLYTTKPSTPSTFIDTMVQLAIGEIGVVEVPKNSNTGPRVIEYQKATWLEGTYWPYCAALICWIVREAMKKTGRNDFQRPQTAGAFDFENWAKTRAKSDKVELLPASTLVKKGDFVIFDFSHIGISIEDEKDGIMTLVEGNTDVSGSRDGGGVYKKQRGKSNVRSVIRIRD